MLTVSLLIKLPFHLYIKFSLSAGAMRLPCTPDNPNKTHFLTDYYGETLFKLKMVPFVNSNEKAFLKFYNMPRIQQEGIYVE